MNSSFKEIMREYDKNRLLAERLLEKRREEVYKKVPRIKEIDSLLNKSSIDVIKNILNKTKTTLSLVDELNMNSKNLLAEKDSLLISNGFSKDYFKKIYTCNICNDTGYVGTEKCSCLKQKIIEKHYDLSNLRNVLSIENFDNFDTRLYSNEIDKTEGISPRANIENIFQDSLDFVSGKKNISKNLMFYGSSGLGKTFLCNCIAKDMLNRGKTVLYVTAPQMFKVLEDHRFNRDEMDEPDEYIDMLYKTDVLIIDDLGTEVSTIVTSSELFNIINSRILEEKSIVISTNLEPKDFENQYSDRITSRFFGNFEILKFFGDDIRLVKKFGNKF